MLVAPCSKGASSMRVRPVPSGWAATRATAELDVPKSMAQLDVSGVLADIGLERPCRHARGMRAIRAESANRSATAWRLRCRLAAA